MDGGECKYKCIYIYYDLIVRQFYTLDQNFNTMGVYGFVLTMSVIVSQVGHDIFKIIVELVTAEIAMLHFFTMKAPRNISFQLRNP